MKRVLMVIVALFMETSVALAGPYWIARWYDIDRVDGFYVFGRYICADVFGSFEISKKWGGGIILDAPVFCQ
ncbi:hypothetical protein H5T57_03500 [Candidatus Bipolaricaulota bacterium]|nr:hypothetical protein [Candidatus Bipolaricaulota bacterium]